MNREKKFTALVEQKLRTAQSVIWLDPIVENFSLVGFEQVPGLYLMAPKPSTPRELAVALAIRQVEAEAQNAFIESALKARLQLITPPTEVRQ